MRRSLLDHLQHRVQHAGHGAERTVLALVGATGAVKVSEELVRTVDEMDDQRDTSFQKRFSSSSVIRCPFSRSRLISRSFRPPSRPAA